VTIHPKLKIVLWYLVGGLLILPFFLLDESKSQTFVAKVDQNRPDWGLVTLVIYAVIKYLTFIAGLIMLGSMTFSLLLIWWKKNKEKYSDFP